MVDDTDAPAPESGRRTYLLVDGENIDATLSGILDRRPHPEDRPRWDRLLGSVRERFDAEVTPLFFMNASSGSLPMAFVQALTAMDFRPVPLSGPPGMKVVDVGIQRTLGALADRDGDVVLASHDGDFLGEVQALLGTRRVAVLGFREFLNAGYAALEPAGLELLDLEHDAKCFTYALPRLRIIPIEEFDPADFL
jgi:uncharacterized protein